MFTDIPGTIPYKDPWLTDYDERLIQMSARTRRIAYFYELPDTSTFRYRAFNPGLSLAFDSRCDVSAAWFDHRDLQADDSFIKTADTLIICRTRYDAAVARMLATARAARIPVLFDCDDLVFDSRRTHLLIDSLDQSQSDPSMWNTWFAYIGRLHATFSACDGFITTNAFLAERARDIRPEIRTSLMPNYLNPDQQRWSERIYEVKRSRGWKRTDQIHIGYFSGSPSHARDFAIASSAIAALMDEDQRVVLRIVGFLDLDKNLAKHRNRIEYFPLQDFLNLQRLIGEVEINIAPLQDNVFTNCKSELKYFEAAICGTLTVATPTFTFKNSIKHGFNGLLSPSHAWLTTLREAIALVDDMANYSRIAEAAFTHVQSRYDWKVQGHNIIDAVFKR